MTIASEIQRIQTNVANAYDALENLGATMPATEDTDHLVSTIQTVSTGDEVSAKNSSGSAVSSGDKVWIDDVTEVNYIDNYGTYQAESTTLTITDEELFSSTSANFIYGDTATSNATTRDIIIKLKTSAFAFTNSGCARFFCNGSTTSLGKNFLVGLWFGYWTTAMTWVFQTYSSHSTVLKAVPSDTSSFPLNDYFLLKLSITSSTATSYYSLDEGETWIQIESISAGYINNYTGDTYKYCYIGNGGKDGTNGQASVYVDLTGCSVMKDGEYEWNPVERVEDTYTAIVPFADITQEALSGVAQENIAVNATGTVKTILPE